MRRSPSPLVAIRHILTASAIILSFAIGRWSSSTSQAKKHIAFNDDGSWVLAYSMTFKTREDLTCFSRIWERQAVWAKTHEPWLLQYKLLRSDKEAHRILLWERYTSREHYLRDHRGNFGHRRIHEEWNKAGCKPVVSEGHSYVASEIGWV